MCILTPLEGKSFPFRVDKGSKCFPLRVDTKNKTKPKNKKWRKANRKSHKLSPLSKMCHCPLLMNLIYNMRVWKKGKKKVQGVPQSQTAALPRPQEEEKTDKSKQAQTEQTYEKH